MRERKPRRGSVLAGLILLAPALAACSSVPKMPSLSSMFGSDTSKSNTAAAYTPPTDFECPSVTIRRGTGTLSVSANPAEPTPLNQRYQATIAETARECRLVGPMLSMKVGVQGRVVIGPAGSPGVIDVPLRIAVVEEGVEPKTIVSKLHSVTITVPPSDFNVPFTYVDEELVFPMPKGSAIDSYVVYVGFDPLGAKDNEKKKPPPKSARPRRRT